MLKVGAIGGIFALRFALVRKNRAEEHDVEPEAEPVPVAAQRRSSHPVSRKKKRRRRR
jgi:hypothetical protein